MATYRIHPGIGIARLGNSDTEFYLAPETPAALPQACDGFGNPQYGPDGVAPVPVKTFKDAQGRVKRQAARFQIFAYDELNRRGPAPGDRRSGGGRRQSRRAGRHSVACLRRQQEGVAGIQFDATLKGEHGYASGRPSPSQCRRHRPGPRPADHRSRPAQRRTRPPTGAPTSTARAASAPMPPPFRPRACSRSTSIRSAR